LAICSSCSIKTTVTKPIESKSKPVVSIFVQIIISALDKVSKEFIFKGKYLQRNREKGDRDSLTSLILLLTITGRKETSEWKLIDKDTREHVYPTLTLDDFKLMAFHMQSQLSKALKTESEIIARLKTLLDEELKIFNPKEEFEKLWN